MVTRTTGKTGRTRLASHTLACVLGKHAHMQIFVGSLGFSASIDRTLILAASSDFSLDGLADVFKLQGPFSAL
jgi:hypothetical protein